MVRALRTLQGLIVVVGCESFLFGPGIFELAAENPATGQVEAKSNQDASQHELDLKNPSRGDIEERLQALFAEEDRLVRSAEQLEESLSEVSEPSKVEKYQAEMESLWRKAEEVRREIDAILKSEGSAPAVPLSMQRQIEQLYLAADNLRSAGMDDDAEQLLREAEGMVAEFHEQMRIQHEQHLSERRWEELEEEVVLLREEVADLREQMREMHDFLEDLIGEDASFGEPDQSDDDGDRDEEAGDAR